MLVSLHEYITKPNLRHKFLDSIDISAHAIIFPDNFTTFISIDKLMINLVLIVI